MQKGFIRLKNAESLGRHMEELSVHLLRRESRLARIDLQPPGAKQLVYSHWMAMILVSGPQVKITFKVHFKTKTAQTLASAIYQMAPDQVSTQRALDYMREFCNLIAGSLKSSLKDNGYDVGISLPMVSRGFDEIFSVLSIAPDSSQHMWRLSHQESDVICTVDMELDPAVGNLKLNSPSPAEDDSRGDVEFF